MTTILIALAVSLWLMAAVDELSAIVVGAPGSGKSYAAAWDAVHFEGAVVILDPHVRSLAQLALMHLPESAVLFDRLDDLEHSLGYELLAPADPRQFPDPEKRAQENHRRVQVFVEILLRRRGADSITGTPLLEEWLAAAVALWIGQRSALPLAFLPYAFVPGSDEFRALIRGCVQPDIRAKFEGLEGLKARSLRSEIGSAMRLIQSVFNCPSFRRRTRGGFALGRFLQAGGKLLVEGGEDIDEDAKRVLLCGISTLVKDHARRRPVPHPPIRLYLDECVNAGLVGPREEKAVAEMRKYGRSYYLISQLLNHPGGADGFLQVCVRHEAFRTPHYELARKMATEMEPLWRSDDRTRAERIADLTSAIMRQKPGHRHVKDASGAWAEYVEMLDDNLPEWPGLKAGIIAEKLEWIHRREEYRVSDGTPSSTSPTDTPSPADSTPKFSPAERWKRGSKKPPESS